MVLNQKVGKSKHLKCQLGTLVSDEKVYVTKNEHFLKLCPFTTGYKFIFEEQNRINESTIGIRNDNLSNLIDLINKKYTLPTDVSKEPANKCFR